MEANCQGLEGEIEDNHENGREYAKIIETPYRNQMLDKQVLRTEKRLTWHMSFLSQEVVNVD